MPKVKRDWKTYNEQPVMAQKFESMAKEMLLKAFCYNLLMNLGVGR
ncbi:MAG: hypothetical protein ACP5PX_03470 [Candidatus Hadarchaeum sp.]